MIIRYNKRYVTDVLRTHSRFVKYVGGMGSDCCLNPKNFTNLLLARSTSEIYLITNKRGGHYSTGVNIFREGVCK